MVILTKMSLEMGYEASSTGKIYPATTRFKTQYRPAQ
jgi:hypothetical protein